MAVALGEPRLVVALLEGEQGEAQLLHGLERLHPQQLLLSVRMKRSAQPLPSGAATNDGLERMPRKRSSPWKWSLRYWLPWSWRRLSRGDARPVAAVVRTAAPGGALERLEARAGASPRGCRRTPACSGRRDEDRGVALAVVRQAVASVPHSSSGRRW